MYQFHTVYWHCILLTHEINMVTGCSVTGQCDRNLSGAVVRPQSLPQAVAGPLSWKGLHIYMYCTVNSFKEKIF